MRTKITLSSLKFIEIISRAKEIAVYLFLARRDYMSL